MSEIVTSHPAAVSIGERVVCADLSNGQRVLLELLRDAYSTSTPITRAMIRTAYFKAHPDKAAVMRLRYVWIGGHDANGYRNCEYRPFRTDDPENAREADWGAMNWFRQNLGACIMKGKLVAIPVIEAE